MEIHFITHFDLGTAIHRAIMNGHVGCVRLLLERGADPLRVTSNGGNAPLHLACEQQVQRDLGLLLRS